MSCEPGQGTVSMVLARLWEGTDQARQASPSCCPRTETEEEASTAPRGPELLQLCVTDTVLQILSCYRYCDEAYSGVNYSRVAARDLDK